MAISFQTFNPYHALYPTRKVVSREVLDLAKHLRAHGQAVQFLPDDERPLQWLAYKGIGDLFADPLVIEVASTVQDIVTGLVSAWVYGRMKSRGAKRKSRETRVVIQTSVDGREVRSRHDGSVLSDAQYSKMLRFALEKSRAINRVFAQVPPDPSYPWPVFLEHTPQHVGWAKIWETDSGLRTETQLFDRDVQARVKRKDLAGLSVAGIVRESVCSICSEDYATCPHIGREEYNGVECGIHIKAIDICDFSIVRHPVNPRAKIDQYNLKRDA